MRALRQRRVAPRRHLRGGPQTGGRDRLRHRSRASRPGHHRPDHGPARLEPDLMPFGAMKSLQAKLAEIKANPRSRAFILADAKDADMAFGVRAPGPR